MKSRRVLRTIPAWSEVKHGSPKFEVLSMATLLSNFQIGAKHSSPSLHPAAPSGKICPYNIIYGISMFLQKLTRQWVIIVILWISALGFVYECNCLNLQKVFDYMKNCWRRIEEVFLYGFIGSECVRNFIFSHEKWN